jgi:hypothetical protein
MSFAAITLCVAPQRVFIVVSLYFVIDSVRKLLDTPLYFLNKGVRWVGNVANSYEIVVENLKGRKRSRDVSVEN